MADVEFRCCKRCGQDKPETREHFAPSKNGRGGFEGVCRPCRKDARAEHAGKPVVPAGYKRCVSCDEDKLGTPEFFSPLASGKYGVRAICKVCRTRPWWRALGLVEEPKAGKGSRICRGCARELPATDKFFQPDAKGVAGRLSQCRECRSRRVAHWAHRRSPEYILKSRFSARIRSMITDKGSRRSEGLLGYTARELKGHLERQFLPGMGWDNMATWDVDHIIPVAAFNISTVDDPDFARCWGLPNLRPLWKDANRRKGRKVLTLL